MGQKPIGFSERIGPNHQIAVMVDDLAARYGDNWWTTVNELDRIASK